MSSEFPLMSLELVSPANADELRMRCSMHDHPTEYIESLVGKYRDHNLYTRTFTMMSTLFGSTENAYNKSGLLQLKEAFLTGNLLAAEVADVAGGEALIDILAEQDINFPDISDHLSPEAQLEQAALALQFNGLERYNTATVFHPLIDRWGYKLAPRKQQETLRAGFGVVLDIGKAAISHIEYEALETMFALEYDANENRRNYLRDEGESA